MRATPFFPIKFGYDDKFFFQESIDVVKELVKLILFVPVSKHVKMGMMSMVEHREFWTISRDYYRIFLSCWREDLNFDVINTLVRCYLDLVQQIWPFYFESVKEPFVVL